MRKNRPSRWRVAILTLVCCAMPMSSAHAIDWSPIVRPLEIGVDAVIIRPLGVMNLAIGGLLLGPSLLMSLPNGEATRHEAIETYWTIPYEQVFERELGDL